METNTNIDIFIQYFVDSLSQVDKLTLNNNSKPDVNIYKKMCYISILDTIAKALYPKCEKNKERYTKSLIHFSSWKLARAISIPYLVYKEDKNSRGIPSNITASYTKFRKLIHRKVIFCDNVDIIKLSEYEEYSHANLFYQNRCKLVHEFRDDHSGHHEDYFKPYYREYLQINEERNYLSLVYPLYFYHILCLNLISNSKQHFLKNNIDPFDKFNFDKFEIV